MIELTAKAEWSDVSFRGKQESYLLACEIGIARPVYRTELAAIGQDGGNCGEFNWRIRGSTVCGTAPTLELAKAAVEQALKGGK